MASLLKYKTTINVLRKNGCITISNSSDIRRCYATLYNIKIGSNSNSNRNSYSNGKYIKLYNKNNSMIIKRTIMTDGIFGIIQMSLHTIQSTGLPWWATFALSTILVRSSMFPLTRSQLLYSNKIATAVPEISFLYQLLTKRLQGTAIHQTEERLKIINVFIKGVRASLKIHDFSILRMLSYPAANISIFLTFIISIREMIKHDTDLKYGFQDGGLLWFADLTMKDDTFILPFLALTLSYTALEIAFSNGKGKIFTYTKDFCQCITLLSVPFVIQLPTGIFFYWIPSSMFAITQSMLLRNTRFQRLMNLPMMKKPRHLDTTHKND